jgi:hypothetical protein
MQTSKTTHGMKALAAAASLAVMAMAGHASATPNTFTIVSSSMDQSYDINVAGFGTAIDNGVTFQISGYPAIAGQATPTSLFGFCIDIYHDMYLGNLGYTYTTNQPSGGGLAPNSGTTLSNTGDPTNPLDPKNQISDITNLVDTGFILHQDENSSNYADTEARLAAIQAAIWDVEVPGVVSNPTGGNQTLFAKYFAEYTSGSYTTLADANDKVFTISDTANNPSHQTFAIGWPVAGVPEPASWGLMLTGFFGMGSLLRAKRKQRAAVAA